MQYTVETLIACDRDRVVELFSNPENMAHWAEGFQRLEPLTGEAGAAGSTNKLYFKQKNKKQPLELIETIELNELPDRFTATYACKGVWNRADNRFAPTEDGQTRWIAAHTFRFSGFMKLIGLVFAGAFPKETRKQCAAFKTFVEKTAPSSSSSSS